MIPTYTDGLLRIFGCYLGPGSVFYLGCYTLVMFYGYLCWLRFRFPRLAVPTLLPLVWESNDSPSGVFMACCDSTVILVMQESTGPLL